ncbi:exosortase-associated EpsI family protein [Planctomycetales bacterium ZRK34]|nr:exosortase-associated EpsI family protein [Planctomycetales bacterium ZRK34]
MGIDSGDAIHVGVRLTDDEYGLMRNKLTMPWMAPLLALMLLGALGAETMRRPQPEAADPYHARVAAAAEDLPKQIGDWVGTDEPIRRAAVQMLKPNVIYNRVYYNSRTGQRVVVLIVQCKDARDIAGHYPPICYPGSGLNEQAREPFDRTLDNVTIHGMQYVFASDAFGSQRLTVDNFILVPDHEVVRDMKAVYARAWDFLKRFFGAAQVQVVFSDPKLDDAEREEIFNTMIEAHMPLIKAILQGEGK